LRPAGRIAEKRYPVVANISNERALFSPAPGGK
jgi:hypothetical protein